MKVYTIGFCKKSAKEFFNILKKAKVEKLLDIRLNNTAQIAGFTKKLDLKYFCEECHDILYEHLPLLGPTDDLLKTYKKTKNWNFYEIEFSKILMERPIIAIFNEACKNVENICLLCSEPTAEKCHRRLVAEFIASHMKNIEIIHLK